MAGVITVVLFFAAVAKGGWWWVWFVLACLVWLGSSQQKKETEAAAKPSLTSDQEKKPATDPHSPHLATQLVQKVSQICARYNGAGFYLAGTIPSEKRDLALKHYPPPLGGEIIAVITASADTGIAIGTTGVSWRNGPAVPSKSNHLIWAHLIDREISQGSFWLDFGNGIKFDTRSLVFSKSSFLKLLKEVQLAAREEISSEGQNHSDITGTVERQRVGAAATKTVAAANSVSTLDVNDAEMDALIALPGIGVPEAKLILRYREAGGRICSLEQLADIIKVKPHVVARLRDKLNFEVTEYRSRPVPRTTTMTVGRTVD